MTNYITWPNSSRVRAFLAVVLAAYVWAGLQGCDPAMPDSDDQESFAGLGHQVLGSARLSFTNEGLVVADIGTSGADGVSIDLGEADIHLNLGRLPDAAPGASLVIEFQGAVESDSIETLAITEWVISEDNWLVTTDFSALGSPTCRLDIIRAGEVVFTASGLQGQIVGFPSGVAAGCCYLHGNSQCSYVFGQATDITVPSTGETVSGDHFRIVAESPSRQYRFISNVLLRAQGLTTFTIEDEWVMMQEVPHKALGSARMQTRDGRVTVTNIGQTGDDGLRFDFLPFIYGTQARTLAYNQQLPAVASGSAAMFTIETFGQTVNGSQRGALLARVQANLSPDEIEFDANSTDLPVSVITIRAFNDGQSVLDVDYGEGVVVVASCNELCGEIAVSVGELESGWGYSFEWPESFQLSVGDQQVMANRVEFEAESGLIANIDSVAVTVREIDSLRVSGAEVTVESTLGLPFLDE